MIKFKMSSGCVQYCIHYKMKKFIKSNSFKNQMANKGVAKTYDLGGIEVSYRNGTITKTTRGITKELDPTEIITDREGNPFIVGVRGLYTFRDDVIPCPGNTHDYFVVIEEERKRCGKIEVPGLDSNRTYVPTIYVDGFTRKLNIEQNREKAQKILEDADFRLSKKQRERETMDCIDACLIR